MQPNLPTIDDNSNGVALATWFNRVWNPITHVYDTYPVPTPIRINPIKKAVRIEVIPRVLTNAQVPYRMPIDANSQHVAGALTHDSNQFLNPLSVDIIGNPTIVRALRTDITIIP